jgi:phosphoribosylformimino-5-aminoimidazole carboxamide ribotide isomerase
VDIYPAIDIKGGCVVRASGAPGEAARDPLAQAEAFAADGARWIHVVDLDRALGTGGDNGEWVRRVCALPGVAVQVGGNVHTASWAREAVDMGAERVVFGTTVASEAERLEQLVALAGSARAAIALDVRDGVPGSRDDPAPLGLTVAELLARARAAGVPTLLHRDLRRDGALAGANLADAAGLVEHGFDVIAAGGIAGLAELEEARRRGLAGVIVGRALYEGRFTLPEAIACSA